MIRWDATPFDQICRWAGFFGFLALGALWFDIVVIRGGMAPC